MLVYLFNILFVGLICFCMRYIQHYKKIFLWIVFIYLFLFSSFRDESIGSDYHNYVFAFYKINYDGTYYMEKGYVFLNEIVAFFTDEYFGIAIAVNILLVFPLYIYITQQANAKYWGLCAFIFAANPYMYIQSTFNIMRQACATGIILLGMNFLLHDNERLWKKFVYVIFVLLAAQFHRIAYYMLILLIVLKIKWTVRKWAFMMMASIIGRCFLQCFLYQFVDAFPVFNPHYIERSASPLDTPVYLAFILFIYIFILSNYHVFEFLTKRKKQLVDIYLFSLCFLIFSLPNNMLYRVYIIFAFCSIPSISALIEGIASSTHHGIRNEAKIIEVGYGLYYLLFYILYIGYLTLKQDTYYIPFTFVF